MKPIGSRRDKCKPPNITSPKLRAHVGFLQETSATKAELAEQTSRACEKGRKMHQTGHLTSKDLPQNIAPCERSFKIAAFKYLKRQWNGIHNTGTGCF